ncbi:hypothetical protein [Kutzneria buriramensis]|uniref:Uncharacterized protein n=1 Tax=Kutzneria buriramensis TaxID=1045776 RepID=A0A3E0GXW6_9PSEU|nr:hypothetical protein [Kutzneria buriramensis]REH31114.1 hypothetical protein BCF44_122137 [Kutzneria buriramensis]
MAVGTVVTADLTVALDVGSRAVPWTSSRNASAARIEASTLDVEAGQAVPRRVLVEHHLAVDGGRA